LSGEFDGNGVLDSTQPENLEIQLQSKASNRVDIDVSSLQQLTDSASAFALAQSAGTITVDVLRMEQVDDEDIKQGLSTYGVFFELTTEDDTNRADELTIEYPLSQRGADVFVTMGEAVTTRKVGGVGGMSQIVHPINVGATKLASQVPDVSAQNLIVVGGPCANQAAAEVMGNPQPCGKDFEPGKVIID